MGETKRLVKNTVIIAIGNLSTKVISFFIADVHLVTQYIRLWNIRFIYYYCRLFDAVYYHVNGRIFDEILN